MIKSELNEMKKIMFEADPKDKHLHPNLKLIKPYPGMALKAGTIFNWDYEWPGYVANRRHSSEWTWEYFKPWIGKFFKEIKRKEK